MRRNRVPQWRLGPRIEQVNTSLPFGSPPATAQVEPVAIEPADNGGKFDPSTDAIQ